jgi:hypothetical protein
MMNAEGGTGIAPRVLVLRSVFVADKQNITLSLPRDLLKRVKRVAADTGCDVLWTEDLTDGQVLRGVRIQNPFVDRP